MLSIYNQTITVLRPINPSAPEYQDTWKVWVNYGQDSTYPVWSFESDTIAVISKGWEESNIIELVDGCFEVFVIDRDKKQPDDIRLFGYFDSDNPQHEANVKSFQKRKAGIK